MTGAEIAAELGEGWAICDAGSAKRGQCVVFDPGTGKQFIARYPGASGTGNTPAVAVESCLLAARASLRAELERLEWIRPGILQGGTPR